MKERAQFDVDVKAAYLAGKTTYEIAFDEGCSQGSVARSLLRTKTPMRKGGRHSRRNLPA